MKQVDFDVRVWNLSAAAVEDGTQTRQDMLDFTKRNYPVSDGWKVESITPAGVHGGVAHERAGRPCMTLRRVCGHPQVTGPDARYMLSDVGAALARLPGLQIAQGALVFSGAEVCP